jgi:hypothetical protein
MEKAYAKFHGNYTRINGGRPKVALANMTGGVADGFSLDTPEAKEEINSGALWEKCLEIRDRGEIMCAASHHGKDTDKNSLGIV